MSRKNPFWRFPPLKETKPATLEEDAKLIRKLMPAVEKIAKRLKEIGDR